MTPELSPTCQHSTKHAPENSTNRNACGPKPRHEGRTSSVSTVSSRLNSAIHTCQFSHAPCASEQQASQGRMPPPREWPAFQGLVHVAGRCAHTHVCASESLLDPGTQTAHHPVFPCQSSRAPRVRARVQGPNLHPHPHPAGPVCLCPSGKRPWARGPGANPHPHPASPGRSRQSGH